MNTFRVSGWDGMHMRTGKVGVDRLLTKLENDVRALESAVSAKRLESMQLWDKHAPAYAENGERLRGGNSGGWE